MSTRRADPATAGVLIVDKPAGMTSHDVVSRVRRLAGTRRVGHAGTLDPMATGVLVIGIGTATRLLTYLVGLDKAYRATIRLGVATTTDDAEGEATATRDASAVTRDQVLAGLAALTGEIDQVPSSVSAIKVDGKRAYARVRGGEQVALPPRRVTVSRLDAGGQRPATVDGVPVLDVDVHAEVSSGTYIRALARDLGAALGVGGHLTALRRTRVGPFAIDHARTLEQLADELTLLPPAAAAAAVMPVRQVDSVEAQALSHGQWLSPSGRGAEPTAAVDADGRLLAVLGDQTRRGAEWARPLLVFPA